jgi:hypothetical protein
MHLFCKKCDQIYITTNKISKEIYSHFNENDDKTKRNSLLVDKDPFMFNLLTYQNYHECNEFHFEPICCAECNVNNKLIYDVSSNDIKCLKCKDLDFKDNGKLCDSLYDYCVYCKTEFEGKLKIYNFLEKRDIEYSIRLSIMKNQYAYSTSDLKGTKESLNFAYIHNLNNCKEKLYMGEYNDKKIIICNDCKKLWYYDKYKFDKKNIIEIGIKLEKASENNADINVKNQEITTIEKKDEKLIERKSNLKSALQFQKEKKLPEVYVELQKKVSIIEDLDEDNDEEQVEEDQNKTIKEKEIQEAKSLNSDLESKKKSEISFIIEETDKSDSSRNFIKAVSHKKSSELIDKQDIINSSDNKNNEKTSSTTLNNKFNTNSLFSKKNIIEQNPYLLKLKSVSNNNIKAEGSVSINLNPLSDKEKENEKEEVYNRARSKTECEKQQKDSSKANSNATSSKPKTNQNHEYESNPCEDITRARSNAKSSKQNTNQNHEYESNPCKDITRARSKTTSNKPNTNQNHEYESNPCDYRNEVKKSDKAKNMFPKRMSEIRINEALGEFNCEDYKVISKIGEGSFGKIFYVEDNLKRGYVMKKIISSDINDLDLFAQEFELINKIRHDGIMRIYSICRRKLDETTYVLYILMEKAVTDWDREIKARAQANKAYSEDDLLLILKQCVDALEFLQTHKISHRDIKPQNILLFENGLFKMADFGEARTVKKNQNQKEMTLRGTELYMSPILMDALNQRQQDVFHDTFKSDVFSLGLCFLYAATLNIDTLYKMRGSRDVKSITPRLKKILKPLYSEFFVDLILKMLEIDESKRMDFIDLNYYLNKNGI